MTTRSPLCALGQQSRRCSCCALRTLRGRRLDSGTVGAEQPGGERRQPGHHHACGGGEAAGAAAAHCRHGGEDDSSDDKAGVEQPWGEGGHLLLGWRHSDACLMCSGPVD
eukprot:1177110-Prorocentrum_minimum.AAC.7